MYKLLNYSNTTVLRLADNAFIPFDTCNSDYIQYQDWLAEGNTPESADPLPPEVVTCTPWQIRKALNNWGQRQTVEDAVAASGDIMLKDGWEFATEFVSNDTFVIQMGVLLGLNADGTREFIRTASSL